MKAEIYPLDHLCPASVLNDLKNTVEYARSKKGVVVRALRVPMEHLQPMIEKVCEGRFTPFVPTLLGLPVECAFSTEPQVLVVADTDEALSIDANHQEEDPWQQSFSVH